MHKIDHLFKKIEYYTLSKVQLSTCIIPCHVCQIEFYFNYYWKQINKFRLEWSPVLVLGAVWIGLPFLNLIESMSNL